MKWTDEFLDEKRQVCDPLADSIIEKIVQLHGIEASRTLFDKLIRNIDLPLAELPGEIDEFLDQTVTLPTWLDEQDIIDSNRFFADHGPKLLLLLYFKSLPLLYSDVKGAPVLVKTSRLTHQNQSLEVFARRIAETGQFLLNVMANDNFHKNDIAINSIRRIRLIHAAIRQFASTGWDEATLGKPINQEDLALTLMTFSVSLIDGLEQLMVAEDYKLKHAYFERWRAIGVLLGIDDDLIPESIEDGRLLLKKILQRNSGVSDAGKLLTDALIDFAKHAIPGKIFDVAPEALIIYLTGDDIAKNLGVINKAGCLGFGLPALISSLFRLGERLEGKSQRLEYISSKLSRKMVEALIGYFDKYKQRKFNIPREFETFWEMQRSG